MSGCTDAEIAAITAHKARSMVGKYTQGARQKKLAESADRKRDCENERHTNETIKWEAMREIKNGTLSNRHQSPCFTGAGDGNRTRVISLEGWRIVIDRSRLAFPVPKTYPKQSMKVGNCLYSELTGEHHANC